MITLETPLSEINGIGPRFLKALAKLRITNVRELLWHFPVRYEDFSELSRIADLSAGQSATIQAVVKKVQRRRSWRRRMTIVEALLSDGSGSIKAVWFNQPFVANILYPGRLANFSGKVSVSEENELYLSHPAYEAIRKRKAKNEEEETRHTGRLVPVYAETRGLTSRGLRFLIHPILKNLEEIPEWLPADVLRRNGFAQIKKSLDDIHFPEKIEDALAARKRFSFEDLFLLQLFNLQQKSRLKKEKAPLIKTDIENLKNALNSLPFELTLSQKRSLWEISKDLEKGWPMNRLLQGDVGSGKTVIAALASLVAAENGYQSAFMAPTEVLANQHFATLKNLFGRIKSKSRPVLGLLTAETAGVFYEAEVEAKMKKSELVRKIVSGEVTVTVGTHSLIQKSVRFGNLGLVVIDEQHRFGVRQRQVLAVNPGHFLPHFLSMSATPIPRTLMMTVFGDLDLSSIDELPKGRKPIITKIVSPENREKAYAFIRGQVRKGRQAFVVCPRIEPTKADDESSFEKKPGAGRNQYRSASFWETKTVKEEYDKLSRKIFPDLQTAMLHGKMKAKEKEETMKKFKNREFDILISTSVIEVGVDVPNASIMWIESAERFGLAQLYQLRGRVGRGEHQSFCFLFTESGSNNTKERLAAILKAGNGFELAEKDLELRGPGEFLGEKQTGLPDTAMRALQSPELIKASRTEALAITNASADLRKYTQLKEKVSAFRAALHRE